MTMLLEAQDERRSSHLGAWRRKTSQPINESDPSHRAVPGGEAPSIATGAGIEIRVARSLAEMDAVGAAWRALEAQSATPAFFQSYAWCRHVAATLEPGHHKSGRSTPLRPFILTAWQDRTLIAVWPLRLASEGGALTVTDFSAPFGQYADILMAEASSQPSSADGTAPARWQPEALCRLLIEHARRLSRADAIVLRKVRGDTPLGRVLAEAGRPLDAPQRAPYVSMTGFATFEAFHATTKSKTRKNVRNAMHRLEKFGSVTHRVERRSARMDAALVHCFDLRSTWLEEKGLTSTAFAHPAFGDLVRGLADPASHDVDVVSMMLMLDGAPISIHYGFIHNGRYYAFMAARDPAHDVCSPGKVHLEHLLKALFGLGVDTVDLLAPAMPYKLAWSTHSIETLDFCLTWSLRGRLAIDLWRRHVRPLTRSAFLALPAPMRQRLAGLMRAPG